MSCSGVNGPWIFSGQVDGIACGYNTARQSVSG
jgi:hypothetical protein